MNVIIRFGTQVMSKQFVNAPTVGTVVNSVAVKAELGYGDNVRATVNGAEQGMDSLVEDGSTIVVETSCNAKADKTVS